MKKVLALLLSAIMLFALCACGSSAPAQTEAPAAPAEEGKADAPASSGVNEYGIDVDAIDAVNYSMGDPATTGTFLTENAQYFCNTLKEITGGKMVVDLYADGLLGNEEALMTNIQIGSLEMADFSSTFANLVKHAGIFDFPYFITDRAQIELLEQGGVIDEIRKEAESYNIKLIAMNENGFRQITNNVRPIVEPDDLKGIVIRTPSNSLRVKTFETFGATPVAISFSELYQSLSQGICNAQENPVSQVISAQLYDFQNYVAISNHVYTPGWICMNLDLYNSLSDAQKAAVDLAGKMTTAHVYEVAADVDAEMLQQCIDKGMEVSEVNIDAFRAKVMPLWDEFADNVGGTEYVQMAKDALGY